MNELVTVVIPVRNRVSTITRALESVLCQTVLSTDIIVVDDGSMDSTPAVVETYQQNHAGIHLIRFTRSSGAQAARNAGIHTAKGLWIAFLDSDDEWLPQSLEQRLRCASETGAPVIHSDGYARSTIGGSLELMRLTPLQGQVYEALLAHPAPAFPALLVKKEVLERIEYLDEQIFSYQEWDTAIRLAKTYPFGFVEQPTFIWNRQERNAISNDALRIARGYEQVVAKHLHAICDHAGYEAAARHYWIAAQSYRHAHAWLHAARCAARAVILRRKQEGSHGPAESNSQENSAAICR